MNAPAFSQFGDQGVILALAWFFVVNLAASGAVIGFTRRQDDRGAGLSPDLWFALRILPAASAAAFVLAFFVPSYWRFEPRDATEAVDWTLTLCASAAAAMVGAALVRGAGAWRAAIRRTSAWMQTARPLALPGTSIPAFEVDAGTPLLALAGVFRPRLLVTRGLIDALTPEELAASIAHEIGHSRARDNLKRLIMRSSPDLFAGTSSARAIERRWAAAAEHSADRIASHEEPRSRCALASALVKVARLTPEPRPLGEPISTLVGGGDIASRVCSLLDDAARPPTEPSPMGAWMYAATLVLGACVMYAPVLRVVHQATEALVQFLP